MEDDLKFSGNIKQLKFSENGRLPQFKGVVRKLDFRKLENNNSNFINIK